MDFNVDCTELAEEQALWRFYNNGISDFSFNMASYFSYVRTHLTV
jgi:hypothetical protein